MQPPDPSESPGPAGTRQLRIGNCLLDLGTQQLVRGQTIVPLDPKAIGVLLHLAERAPDLVATEDLLARTWQGTIVGDNALQQVIHRLREGLGDDARSPRFIETLHRRGYRLLIPPENPVAGTRSPPNATAGRTSLPVTLAVLPFVDRSGGAIDHFFSAGLALEVGNRLATIARLRVISHEAVTAALAAGTPRPGLAAALGAERALEGSVLLAHGRVRVAVQLHDLSAAQQLRAFTCERAPDDLLALHGDIASTAAEALGIDIAHDQVDALTRPGTLDPTAHRLYQRALGYLPTSIADNQVAIELLEVALDHDPAYAEARAVLAWRYCWAARNGSVGARKLALEHVERAMQTDDSLAWVRFARASVLLLERRQLAAAMELRHAIERNPSHRFALQDLSFVLSQAGHADEALELALRAVRVAPASANTCLHLAVPLIVLGEYERARSVLAPACARHPDAGRYRCHAALMVVDLLTGNAASALERANDLLDNAATREIREIALAALEIRLLLGGGPELTAELTRWCRVAPASFSTIATTPLTIRSRLALALWTSGSRQRAASLFEEAIEAALKEVQGGHESAFPLFELAAVQAVRGNHRVALDWLEQACDAGYLQHRVIELEPMFAGLQRQEQCQRLLARMQRASARLRSAAADAGLLAEVEALH